MNAENMLPIDLLRKRRSLVAAKIVDPGPTDHELSLIIEAGLSIDRCITEGWAKSSP